MDIAAQRGYEAAKPETITTARVIGSGSFVEGLVGAGALALAILGLADVLPSWMAIVATITVGAAFLIEGIAISSRMADLMESDKSGQLDIADVGGGITSEFLAGLGGITLGVLALLGIIPETLMAIAVIVFGGALMLGSGTTSRLNYLNAFKLTTNNARIMAKEAVSAAAGLQIVAGVGAAVLGILALVDQPRLTFILIGLLVVSASRFFSGSALGGRLLGMFRG
ncbi:MAG TPA: hypothetical protein VHP36_04840 [Chitinispirillaceae bacterium]|nr:hypothetical protein [Chitinispirillaceae bacterium]